LIKKPVGMEIEHPTKKSLIHSFGKSIVRWTHSDLWEETRISVCGREMKLNSILVPGFVVMVICPWDPALGL
jgi:hypothetical protein